MYPLYEFPPTIYHLEEIVTSIDLVQPLSIEETRNLVSRIVGKRPSRTNITVKELKKLKIIEEHERCISLSWETQLYVDMERDLTDLLLYLVYRIPELFNLCNLICKIDPNFELSKPELLLNLFNYGYEEEKVTTAREKLFGIVRLVEVCKKEEVTNPFSRYKEYIEFLYKIDRAYLDLTAGLYNKNLEIVKLKRKILEDNSLSEEIFDDFFIMLYRDPIFSSNTSFTTVIKDFATEGYYLLNNVDYYYLKLKKSFVSLH